MVTTRSQARVIATAMILASERETAVSQQEFSHLETLKKGREDLPTLRSSDHKDISSQSLCELEKFPRKSCRLAQKQRWETHASTRPQQMEIVGQAVNAVAAVDETYPQNDCSEEPQHEEIQSSEKPSSGKREKGCRVQVNSASTRQNRFLWKQLNKPWVKRGSTVSFAALAHETGIEWHGDEEIDY